MSVYIHSIATANPPYKYEQSQVRDFVKEQLPAGSMAQRITHRVYTSSGIETRYSAIPDLFEKYDGESFFRKDSEQKLQTPDTKFRNDWYIRHSKPLFTEVCKNALEESEFSTKDITHLITVSCTGFYAPGPDYFIVRELGLNVSVQRYHLGFMGCYAAFPAMRLAKSICESQPDAVVLIADLELCSIHLQFKEDSDSIISGSVFADGAAGMVISSRKPQLGIEILALETSLTNSEEQDMAWTIGNTGFDMVLSAYVPRIIEAELGSLINPFLEKHKLSKADLDTWAVHPGGKSILQKTEQSLGINAEQLKFSYSILNEFRNMSSATILFILEKILNDQSIQNSTFPALAFGPGLTVEFGLLKKISS